jgi:hypothetical protein
MKKLLLSIILFVAMYINLFAQEVQVSGNITANKTFTADKIWMLNGFVRVKEGVTLTIEPGTIVKGVSDTKAALIIEQGGKIMAQGTAKKPIVFTSDKDVFERNRGDWGGLVICGKAKTNKNDYGPGDGKAEGGIDSHYGGNNDNDNSGILQYCRIEFPGIPLASTANSEINGLTMYAVGNATTIDHIQVSYSGDDSYEWFGGTVNCKYLICIRGLDDEYDTDNGYNGTVQFAVGLRDPDVADQSKSNGYESDNDAGGTTTTPTTNPAFVNVSLYGPYDIPTRSANPLFARAMHIRRGSALSTYNSLFAGWPVGLCFDSQKGNTLHQDSINYLQIENCVMAAMKANFNNGDGPKSDSIASADYWNTPSRNNKIYATNADLMVNNPYILANPDWTLKAGSPLLTGASFTNERLANTAFLDKSVTFRGAFGTEDWTESWALFNPQAFDYSTPGVTRLIPVGLKNMASTSKVTLYPNPATTDIRLSNIEPNSRVQIIDIKGKTIKSVKLNNSVTVNISDLENGVYFVKVYSTDNSTSVSKFIKQ